MSPFVYQFIGVKKEYVDNIISSCKINNIKLLGILPVPFLFAKYVQSYDPFFFVFQNKEECALVASEYGGVYFSGTYKSSSDMSNKLASLLSELSTFNREKPVKRLFSLGDDLKIDSYFEVSKLPNPCNADLNEFQGFEKLLVALHLINSNSNEFLQSYFNIRNFVFDEFGKVKEKSLVKYIAPALVVTTVVFGALIYLNKVNTKVTNTNEKPDVIGAKESSPSEVVLPKEEVKEVTREATKVDKSKILVKIENGAGVSGTASKAKDFLASFGYSVVEIGNAPKFDYSETTISTKKSKRNILALIKADLSKNYTVKDGNDLSEDLKYDVLVIIGKK